MAKGDDQRARNKIDQQGGLAQNRINNAYDTVIPQNQYLWNKKTEADTRAGEDYSGMMKGYQDWLGTNPYGEFINNGGYSPTDVASMRARAISPTRAIYSNALNDINRQTRLNPNSASNAIAARAKVSRDMSSSISDANTNTEAALAQMINEGKRFGINGEQTRQLGGRQAMTSLYGTTPGQASMFGNQVLNSTGQLLDLTGLQNQLGLGIMGRMNEAGQLQGKNQQLFNNILNAGKVIEGIAHGAQG